MSDKVIQLNAWKGQVKKTSKGLPEKTMTNLMIHVKNIAGLGHAIRYNMLADQIEWRGEPLRDSDYVDIQIMIERAGFHGMAGDIPKAIGRLAWDNKYQPIQDYLSVLIWDGRPRLDKMLHRLFGTDDGEYEKTVGSKFMIGAVARAFDPGCKMDNMLVLEGPQNLGKSSAIKALFGETYFTEMVSVLKDHKKFVEQIMGKWVIEFAELASLKDADIDLVKALITMQNDRLLRNYSRVGATEHPRQSVMAASVNPKQGCGYLKDPTGNRRFWPVKCKKILLDMILSNRDQLWAEATHRYNANEHWWLNDEEYALAEAEQNKRQSEDMWIDMLYEFLETDKKYTHHEILINILRIDAAKFDSQTKSRFTIVMTNLGWVFKVGKRNGKSMRLWHYAPDEVEKE